MENSKATKGKSLMEIEDSPSRLKELRARSPWHTGSKGGGVITGNEAKRPEKPSRRKNAGKRSARPVRCKETGRIFASGVEASRFIGKKDNCVCNAIGKYYRGEKGFKRPAAGGYTWEYYNGPMESKR